MVAQLFMGRASASPYQVGTRAGHLERRFALPVTVVMRTDVATLPADATLSEFLRHHLLANRDKEVAVVDGAIYLGVMTADELRHVPNEQWPTTTVGDHMRTDFPRIEPGMTVRDALRLMEEADVDMLPVLDADAFVGVVTTAEILKLDEILDDTDGDL